MKETATTVVDLNAYVLSEVRDCPVLDFLCTLRSRLMNICPPWSSEMRDFTD